MRDTSLLFLKKRWSYRPKICMSIMERTSPLKASTCSLKRIRLQPWSVLQDLGNQPTSVVWTGWMIPSILRVLRVKFGMKESMSIVQISMFMKCVSTLGWFSNGPILLPNRFIKTSPSRMNVRGWKTRRSWTNWSKLLWNRQLCGIRSRMTFINQPWHFQVANSNDFVSHGPSLWSQISYLWMSQHQRLIRSRQRN